MATAAAAGFNIGVLSIFAIMMMNLPLTLSWTITVSVVTVNSLAGINPCMIDIDFMTDIYAQKKGKKENVQVNDSIRKMMGYEHSLFFFRGAIV